jgi:hypothetical protein
MGYKRGLPVSTSALYLFVQPSVVCNWTEAISLIRCTAIPCSIKSKSICVSNSSSMTVDTESLLGKVYGKFIPAGFFCTHFFHLGNGSSSGNDLFIHYCYPLVGIFSNNLREMLTGPFAIFPILNRPGRRKLDSFCLFST